MKSIRSKNKAAKSAVRVFMAALLFVGGFGVTAHAQLINVVSATSSTADPNTANNGGAGSPTQPPVDSGVAGGVAENNRTATLINPTITKSFNPVYINRNGVSTLTFTITNPNAVPITAATLTDTFPTTPGAMVVAPAPNIVNTTCNFSGGLPVAGAASLSLTGGTIPANGSCTFSVNVTAPTPGVYNNTNYDTTGSAVPFAGANAVALDAPAPAPAVLVVLEPTKSVALTTDTGVVGPSAGDTLTYTITYTLPAGAPAIPNFQITDILPSQVTYVPSSLNVTGATANAAYTGLAANATLLNPTANFTAGNTITATLRATINAATTGNIDNQARGSGTGLPPLTGGGAGGGIPTDADAPGGSIPQPQDTVAGTEPTRVVAGSAPTLGIAKAIEPGAAQMTGALSFTVPYTLRFAVPASSPAAATNVQVVENLSTTFPGASSISVTAPTTAGTGGATAAQCAVSGTFTGTGANTNLLVGNQTLNAGQGCTVAFVATVTYPSVAAFDAATTKNNSATFTAANTPGGAAIASDVSDNGTNPDPTNNNGAGGTNDPTPLQFGTITGNVFQDNDASGTNNAGDIPLAGVTVAVTRNGGGSPINYTTNASGNWSAIVPLSGTTTYTVDVTDSTLPAALRTNATTGNLTTVGSDPEATVAAPTAATPNRTTTADGYARVADLAVDKVSSAATYTQGSAVQYSVVVWNRGPATPISGVTFTDNIPSNVTLTGWTCVGSGAATCSAPSGTTQTSLNALTFGNLATNAGATVPTTGSFVTVTINGTATTAGTGITNTASVVAPAGVTEAVGAGTSANSDNAIITINTPSSLNQTKTVQDSADAGTLAQAGETLTYTVTINNTGGTAATGVTFNDVIPANTSYVAGSAATTSAAPGTVGTTGTPVTAVTGTGLVVPAGGSITVTFQVTVNSPLPANITQISNVATVNGNGTPPANIPTVPDLVIAKSATPNPFIVGQTGTFQFTVTNQGGTTTGANTITVTDTLPVGITIPDGAITEGGANAANWTCTAASNVVTCTSTTAIVPGGSSVFTIPVNVGAAADTGATPDSTNTATVQGGGEPSPNYNNNNTGSTPVNADPRADVTTVVNVTTTPRAPGDTITGTVTFRNAGPSPAAGVTSSITFPSGLTGASIPTVTCTPPVTAGAYNAGTGVVTLSGIPSPLPASATPNYTCNISYVVPANATADQVIASNIGTTTNQGANTLPDTSSVTVPLNSTDLQIVKTDTPASGTYTPGQTVTYTVTVTNNGPDAVTGAQVFDTPGANLTINSVSCAETLGGSTVGCPSVAPTVAAFTTAPGVTLQQLAASGADASVVFTVNATVSSGATGNLVNSATVNVPAGFGDPTPGNNTSTDTNTPSGSPVDLTIAKTDIAPAFVVGQTGNYRLTVSNAAGSVSTSGTITVTDTLPAGITVPNSPPNLTLSGANAANWTCTAASNVITCTSTTPIAGGASSVFEFPVNIGPAAAPSVTNTASVSGGNEPPANNGNNSGTDVTPVQPVADLSIVKTDGVATAPAGGQVTYTVTVSNAGPNSVTGAIVSD
ncbi:MAG: beta strand repeat-containing protein, partial [Deinococcales bacterium]